jgi:hypothetical protein
MSTPQLEERIAQFRKMAEDDPDNELGHFRLGQLLMEAGNGRMLPVRFSERSSSARLSPKSFNCSPSAR